MISLYACWNSLAVDGLVVDVGNELDEVVWLADELACSTPAG